MEAIFLEGEITSFNCEKDECNRIHLFLFYGKIEK